MTVPIIIITCIVSIIAFQRQDIMNRFIFNSVAVSERGEWWRFITSGLVHANWLHLGINMYVFYSFGQQVELIYDNIFEEASEFKFLVLYFGGMVVAMLPSYKERKHDSSYNSLGASGAISAVVFAYILYAPLQNVYLYGLFGLPGVVMGGGYLIYSYYAAKKGGGYLNHSAHLWGAIFGIAYTLVLKPQLFSHFISQILNAVNQ